MIWREIKIGIFIFALCTVAALATVAIYEGGSKTTASAWLLVPAFALIAAAILVSEVFARKLAVKDSELGDCTGVTTSWSLGLMPATVVVIVILSLPPTPSPLLTSPQQPTEAGIAVTPPVDEPQQRTEPLALTWEKGV